MSSPLVQLEEFSPTEHVSPIAGFWRRLTAFGIDSVIIGLSGFFLLFFFFDFFVGLGELGKLVGFTIALLYFGIMNSSLSNGQTFGKQIMRIKVVSKDGSQISLLKSSLRYSILATPFFLNGLLITEESLRDSELFGILLSIIVFGMSAAIIYLFVFNRLTRQSLHDLAVGSYVIRKGESPRKCPPIWKGHYLIATTLLIASVIGPIAFLSNIEGLLEEDEWKEISITQSSLLKLPEVRYSTLSAQKTTQVSTQSSSSQIEWVNSQIFLNKDINDYDSFAREIANVIITHYPTATNKQRINIQLLYGCDIGIASSWKSKAYSKTPREWIGDHSSAF